MELFPADSLKNNTPIQPVNTSSLNNGYVNDLLQVSGMDGARNYLARASSRVALFDKNDDLFYIVSVDINNNKTVRRFRFYEEPEPKPEDIFASKTEIKELKAELKGDISNVQQSICELTNTIAAALSANSISNESGSDADTKKYVPKPKNGFGSNRADDKSSKNASESKSGI